MSDIASKSGMYIDHTEMNFKKLQEKCQLLPCSQQKPNDANW
jgi:hypothetical protein